MKKIETWTKEWSSIATLLILLGTVVYAGSNYLNLPHRVDQHDIAIEKLSDTYKDCYRDIAVIKTDISYIKQSVDSLINQNAMTHHNTNYIADFRTNNTMSFSQKN